MGASGLLLLPILVPLLQPAISLTTPQVVNGGERQPSILIHPPELVHTHSLNTQTSLSQPMSKLNTLNLHDPVFNIHPSLAHRLLTGSSSVRDKRSRQWQPQRTHRTRVRPHTTTILRRSRSRTATRPLMRKKPRTRSLEHSREHQSESLVVGDYLHHTSPPGPPEIPYRSSSGHSDSPYRSPPGFSQIPSRSPPGFRHYPQFYQENGAGQRMREDERRQNDARSDLELKTVDQSSSPSFAIPETIVKDGQVFYRYDARGDAREESEREARREQRGHPGSEGTEDGSQGQSKRSHDGLNIENNQGRTDPPGDIPDYPNSGTTIAGSYVSAQAHTISSHGGGLSHAVVTGSMPGAMGIATAGHGSQHAQAWMQMGPHAASNAQVTSHSGRPQLTAAVDASLIGGTADAWADAPTGGTTHTQMDFSHDTQGGPGHGLASAIVTPDGGSTLASLGGQAGQGSYFGTALSASSSQSLQPPASAHFPVAQPAVDGSSQAHPGESMAHDSHGEGQSTVALPHDMLGSIMEVVHHPQVLPEVAALPPSPPLIMDKEGAVGGSGTPPHKSEVESVPHSSTEEGGEKLGNSDIGQVGEVTFFHGQPGSSPGLDDPSPSPQHYEHYDYYGDLSSEMQYYDSDHPMVSGTPYFEMGPEIFPVGPLNPSLDLIFPSPASDLTSTPAPYLPIYLTSTPHTPILVHQVHTITTHLPSQPQTHHPASAHLQPPQPTHAPPQPHQPTHAPPQPPQPTHAPPQPPQPTHAPPQPPQPTHVPPEPTYAPPQPHHPSPDQSQPHHPSPDQLQPHHPSPDQPQPHHPSPDQPQPHHPSPDQPQPHHPSPDQFQPHHPSPDQPQPHHPSPDQPQPHHPSPDQLQPHYPSPDQPQPHHPSPLQPYTSREMDSVIEVVIPQLQVTSSIAQNAATSHIDVSRQSGVGTEIGNGVVLVPGAVGSTHTLPGGEDGPTLNVLTVAAVRGMVAQRSGIPIQPGGRIPGAPGYRVPPGFRGHVVLGHNLPVETASRRVLPGFNTQVRLDPEESMAGPVFASISGPQEPRHLPGGTTGVHVTLSSGGGGRSRPTSTTSTSRGNVWSGVGGRSERQQSHSFPPRTTNTHSSSSSWAPQTHQFQGDKWRGSSGATPGKSWGSGATPGKSWGQGGCGSYRVTCRVIVFLPQHQRRHCRPTFTPRDCCC